MIMFVTLLQMHGGGAKKGGSGTDEVVNNEPSKHGGAIGGKRGGKASGEQLEQPQPADLCNICRLLYMLANQIVF